MENVGKWKGKAKATHPLKKQSRPVAASMTDPPHQSGPLRIRPPRQSQPAVDAAHLPTSNPPAAPVGSSPPPIPMAVWRSLESLLQSENCSQEGREWLAALSGPSRQRMDELHRECAVQPGATPSTSATPTQQTPPDRPLHPPSSSPVAEESNMPPPPPMDAVQSDAGDQRPFIVPVGNNRLELRFLNILI